MTAMDYWPKRISWSSTRISCKSKLTVVWSNLNRHRYRGDLKRYDDGEDPCEVNSLPGYIMMQHQEYYDLLFEALDSPVLADNAWEILARLPTNPRSLRKILEAEDGINWNLVLEADSYYKLLYNLQIIQYFMQDSAPEGQDWKIKFIETGGFTGLLEVLLNNSEKIEGVFRKKCLDIILKLIGFVVLAGFASFRPDVYGIVQLIRKQSIEDHYNVEEANGEQEKYENNSKSLNCFSLEIIKYQLESKLISMVDFSLLIEKLMKILASILSSSEIEVEDKNIADSALVLWVSCLLHNNSLIETFYNFNTGMNIEIFVYTALTYSESYYMRRFFSNSLTNLCQNVVFAEKMPIPYFLSLLLRHIPSENSDPYKDYTQFFATLCKLIKLYMSIPSQDCTTLITSLMTILLDYQCTEKSTLL